MFGKDMFLKLLLNEVQTHKCSMESKVAKNQHKLLKQLTTQTMLEALT
jgi:hypothetical protein